LRWWDEGGNLLLTGDERAEVERQRAEVERQRAEIERQRAETVERENQRLRERLRALGIDPDALS
jgi:cell shape-determining protein MreC